MAADDCLPAEVEWLMIIEHRYLHIGLFNCICVRLNLFRLGQAL